MIKNKLSRLRRFMDETQVIRDSTGKIRELAAKGTKEPEKNSQATGPAPKGNLSKDEQQELDRLRKRYGR